MDLDCLKAKRSLQSNSHLDQDLNFKGPEGYQDQLYSTQAALCPKAERLTLDSSSRIVSVITAVNANYLLNDK